MSHDRVRAIYEDASGVLWIGTYSGGLNILDRGTRKFTTITHKRQNPTSLCNDQVLCIYEDNTGLIWFGTNTGGISKYDPHRKKFKHFNHCPKDQNSLSSAHVRAFVEDAQGNLWIGTNEDGLNKFDRKNHIFTHYKHDPNKPDSLPDDRVYALYEDSRETLWVGTFGGGLCKFDKTKNSFIHYKHNPSDPGSLSDNQVRSICEDHTGTLWIGTWNGGLDKFDREKQVFKHYTHNPTDPYSLGRNYIITLYVDRSGVLWVSPWREGINRYNNTTDNFTRYLHEKDNLNSLSGNYVFAIYEDRTGMLWVGTEGRGLNKFNRKKNKWTYYSTENGLPNDTVYGILEDEQGNLWLSTNKGLSRFNPGNQTFRNYDTRDGLQSNEFTAGAFYKNCSGEMFFGGINGFNAFYPTEIKDNRFLPPVVITDFKRFNRSMKFPTSLSNLEEIQLPYKDNFISFDFVALNYRVPEKNQYAYKLEGFDDDWIHCGSGRSASYTNLHGGTYVFRVKASNNDGIWNEEGTSIGLVILPPFWETWWFRGMALIVILLSIFAVHRFRTYSIRKRNRQLQEINMKLNKEMAERKQVEKALEASEKKYRNIIEESIDVHHQTDMDGKLVLVSPSGAKLMGYDSPEEMLGKDVARDFYYNPKDREALLSELQKHGKVVNYEVTLKRKDGTPLVMETSSHFFYDEEGKPAGMEGILRDMTDKKRAEEEKQKLQEQLLSAKKMKAVGTLAGGMAHEYNNLMAIIMGNAQILQDSLQRDSMVQDQVQSILTASRRCADLTSQLLSFSRKQMLELKAVDLNQLITDMEEDILRTMGPQVVLVTNLEAKPVPVEVDPGLMNRVIKKIVDNSRDAMPNGGVLTLQIEIVTYQKFGDSDSPLSRRGKFACLTIADTGEGMDQETLQHIFEPFFTTKEVGHGIGLDLSFVYGTVTQHKGWIDATSEPGSGTTMKIYLPVSEVEK